MTSSSTSPPTFFITDRRMLAHKCEWNPYHIDSPKRLKSVLELLEKEQILDQCQLLDSTECSLDDLRLVHSQAHIDRIREASALDDLEQMETLCRGLEDIYVNKDSWKCALLSAGCAVRAMEAVLENNDSGRRRANAFAAIRPPGHHASRDTPCGFCLFNNVAICAKKARKMGVDRVLIIDWDVHAAQGTQYCVEGDPGILLVSAHRYESGQFWPELPESGVLHKYGNTINVPLDEIGCGDAEYAAFMHFLVLPLIHQWQPGLILVSCGFDAALGDPQGEMEVTPAGFAYMTGLLAQLEIPLCLLLEGGYFLESVLHGAHFCMRALLQRAPPILNFCHRPPSSQFLHTLFTVLLTRSSQFPLFHAFIYLLNRLRLDLCSAPDRRKRRQLSPIQISTKAEEYLGDRKLAQLAMANRMYPTRGQYSPKEPAVERQFLLRLRQLLEDYGREGGKTTERALLKLELDADGGQVFLLPRTKNGGVGGMPPNMMMVNGGGGCSTRDLLFRLASADQFLLFYFFFLLPLDFTHLDVQLCGHKLPLDGHRLQKIAGKLEKGGGEMAAMNGGGEKGHENGNGSEGQLNLEYLLDIFGPMKPFFLFQ